MKYLDEVKVLAAQGKNSLQIQKELLLKGIKLGDQTIRNWSVRFNFEIKKRNSSNVENNVKSMIADIQSGVNWTQARKRYNLSYEMAKSALDAAGIYTTKRSDSGKEKMLTEQEVLSRMPSGCRYLGIEGKKYKFICEETKKEFLKSSGKIAQGSPHTKDRGTPYTLETFSQKLMKVNQHTVKLGTFSGTSNPMIVVCPNGHERSISYGGLAWRNGCGTCNNNGTSKAEESLRDWIKSLGLTAEKYFFPKEEKKAGRRKEIDIYIEELKIGIEYCGIYFHSEEYDKKSEGKHYRKYMLAKESGIKLVTIFEDTWLERSNQIKSYLTSKLGKNSRSIGARKCTVSPITAPIYKEFIEKYHIQPNDPHFLMAYGIFFGDELLGVVGYGRSPARSKKLHDPNSLYLNRLCFKTGVTVSGGFSRMIKRSIIDVKKNFGSKYKRIVTWSDNCYSSGDAYRDNGFVQVRPFRSDGARSGLKDGSFWPEVKYAYRGHRLRESELPKDMDDDDKNLLPRIYDCGKKRWERAI